MFVPVVAGKPINLWFGIILLFLVAFQILTGKHWIKTPFLYHRCNGWANAAVALLHAYWGLGIWFLGFNIGS